MGLLSPPLLRLGPDSARVDLRIVPQIPPQVFFGTGEVLADSRDSHINLDWQDLMLEIHPMMDDAM